MIGLFRIFRKKERQAEISARRLEGWMIAKGFSFSPEGAPFAEKGSVCIAYSIYSDSITIGTSAGIYEDGLLSMIELRRNCIIVNGKKFDI